MALGAFSATPARAAACPASVPIANVINSTFTSCEIGDMRFSNFTNFATLPPTGNLKFSMLGSAENRLLLDDFPMPITAGWNFDFTVAVFQGPEKINGVTPAITTTDPNYFDFGNTTDPASFPTPPVTSLVVKAFGNPNTSGANSIYFDVRQTPGPLPVLGAGAAFSLSRRLRSRIRASQPQKL